MWRVLLVMPPEPEVKETVQTGSRFPRIGIAYIAGYLRSKDIDVKIVDSKVLELILDDVANAIQEYRPDVVGLGPFTEEIIQAYYVCQVSKSIDPRIMTVMGGPHASALPARTLNECPELDLVVCGEGEQTFLEILTSPELKNIKGIAYRAENQVIITDPAKPIADIASLPYPAWDLFPLDAYRGIINRDFGEESDEPTLQLPVLSARGCPYKCIFCYKTLPRFRAREAVKVVDEIEYNMREYGATDFFFVDGTFAIDRNMSMGICDEIIQRGLNEKIVLEVETRVDIVTQELLGKLKQAGCVQVYFGVESGDPKMLKSLKKGITLDMAERAVAMAKKTGLKTTCNFIIGLPNETRESIKRTYDFARKLDPDFIVVGIMVPYPGTRVREMAEKGEANYRLISDDWRDYRKQRGGPLELRDITLRELVKIHDWEYLKYFLRPRKLWFLMRTVPFKKLFKVGIQIIISRFPFAKNLRREKPQLRVSAEVGQKTTYR